MGLIWYTILCPNDSNGLALIILFMMAGGIIGPPPRVSWSPHSVSTRCPLVIAAFASLDILVFSYALRYKPLVIAA